MDLYIHDVTDITEEIKTITRPDGSKFYVKYIEIKKENKESFVISLISKSKKFLYAEDITGKKFSPNTLSYEDE